MSKKSIQAKTFGFLSNVVIWFLKSIFSLLAWVFTVLYSLAKKSISNASTIAAQPKGKPIFQGFREIASTNGVLSSFEDLVYNKKNTVGIIIGARGTGKSALGLKILENAASKGRKVYAMGFNEKLLPNWIQTVESPDASNGSFLLVDEGGISFSSRESFSDANKLLSKLLLVARHKDLSLLFIAQNSANIDVNALRQADYVLLKKPSLLQREFERKEITRLYDKAADGFKKYEQEIGLTFVYSDLFSGFASNSLPSFWSEKTSKAFKNVKLSS